jgi:2-octaprenyl-6-methoxyphenol hydroxylase
MPPDASFADAPFDAIVAGLGPAGLTAALALSSLGLRVAAVGQATSRKTDARATALMPASLTLLTSLGVWVNCSSFGQPMTGLRIIDATGRLLRAPETLFQAKELGLESFGACIANVHLVGALERAVRATTNLTLIETSGIANIAIGHKAAAMTLAEGRSLRAPLLVGADGRNSPSRAAAGIATTAWTYPQTALALTFKHARPHGGVSIEFHRASGPLTTVPLPGHASSLVWVETPEEAKRLMALEEAAFLEALRAALHGVLGKIESVTPRAAFPLSGLTAERLAQRRTVLVGEAAHVLPPIGAQGLNLGLRDVACLADVVADAREAGHNDIGEAVVLDAYANARRGDVWTRTSAVDLLNRSLLSSQLPVQAVRGFGLHMLALAPPLRRMVMQEGLAPTQGLPRLMRPETGVG